MPGIWSMLTNAPRMTTGMAPNATEPNPGFFVVSASFFLAASFTTHRLPCSLSALRFPEPATSEAADIFCKLET